MNIFSIQGQDYHQCDFCCDQLAVVTLEFEEVRDEIARDYLCADCGTEVVKWEYPFPAQHCKKIAALRVLDPVDPHYWIRIVYPTVDTPGWGYAIEDSTLWFARCYDDVFTSEPRYASYAAAMAAGLQHIANL